MKSRWVRFAFLLPMTVLMLWLLFVVVPTVNLWTRLVAQRSAGRDTRSKAELWPYALDGATLGMEHAAVVVGAPGTLIEVLIDMRSSQPYSWHPKNVPIRTWRTFVLPVFSMPFWWWVGRGMDGALGRRRLHWTGCTPGSVLAFLCYVMVLFAAFTSTEDDRRHGYFPLFLAFLLWGNLFTVFPVAWFLQWCRPREVAAAAVRGGGRP